MGVTENIPQTSASERVETARKVLDHYDAAFAMRPLNGEDAERLAASLRALITPPAVGESEEEIAERIADSLLLDTDCYADRAVHPALVAAVRAGIQSAHESWEPADVPSQEFMLRHLGIAHSEYTAYGNRHIDIPAQSIDLEVD